MKRCMKQDARQKHYAGKIQKRKERRKQRKTLRELRGHASYLDSRKHDQDKALIQEKQREYRARHGEQHSSKSSKDRYFMKGSNHIRMEREREKR